MEQGLLGEIAVDPMTLAAHVAVSPLDYSQYGKTLGHYRSVMSAGGLRWAANAVLAEMRWPDPDFFFVLLSIKIWPQVNTLVITPQRIDPITVSHVRNWTIADTVAVSAQSPVGDEQKLSTIRMGTSRATFQVARAAAGLSGGTKTVDAAPFGVATLPSLANFGSGITTSLYAHSIYAGHPPVYAENEGYQIQWGATALATSNVAVFIETEWAEVVVF